MGAERPDEGGKGRITQHKVISGLPLRAIDLPPQEFQATQTDALQITVNNSIVAIGTALEVYLTDASRRAVYLNPKLLEKGDHKFTSSDLAAVSTGDEWRAWFASQMAEKVTRSKSDREMIDSVITD